MSRIATTLTLALAVVIAWPRSAASADPAHAAQPALLVSPIPVGPPDLEYRNPEIAVSPAGHVTIVAEAGPRDSARLSVVDIANGGSPDPKALPFRRGDDCRTPALAYDSSGTLHLVWAEKASRNYVICYASRNASGRWSEPTTASRTARLDCGLPRVAVGRDGTVWLAWQAGKATRYSIFLTWRDRSSSFVKPVEITRDRNDHYNLLPRLFPDSVYPLVWYEEVGTTFELRAAVKGKRTGRFDIVTPIEFERLDANQMPWIFAFPSGLLGGTWTDLVGDRVRVLVGIQGGKSRGEGVVADTTSRGDLADPCAVAVDDDTVALAWTARDEVGSGLYIGRVDDGLNVATSRALRLSAYGSYSRPRLAVDRDRRIVHCVWFSDASRGGTGDLYYAALLY